MTHRGMTLTEVLVTMALVCALGAVAITVLPRAARPADVDRHPAQLAATLEAAAAQARADGAAVTVTGLGDALVVRSLEGEERLAFPGAMLAGSVVITAEQTGTGLISLSGPGLPCTQAWVGGYGTANAAPCGTRTAPTATEAPGSSSTMVAPSPSGEAAGSAEISIPPSSGTEPMPVPAPREEIR